MIVGHCHDRILMPTDGIDLTITGKVESVPPVFEANFGQILHITSGADSAGLFYAICPKCRQQSIADASPS